MFPICSIFVLETLGLRLWQNIPTYAAYPPVKKVYPEFPFFFVDLHRKGNLGTFIVDRHFGRCL